MAYFNNKQNIKGKGYIPLPIPTDPSYNPPPTPSQEEGSGVDIPLPLFVGNAKITLYMNKDEYNRMDKKLSDAREFDIIIKEELPLLTPTIVLSSETDLRLYNYAYVDIANRYYYCEITLIENGFYSIKMQVDVLMSHKLGIRKLIGLVNRTQNDAYINKDIPNDDLVVQRGTTTKIYKYNKSLSATNHNVLILAGKPVPFG